MIFNRNNCKVSYCCMENVKLLIRCNNKNVVKRTKKNDEENSTCNFRDKDSCPLNDKCLQGTLYTRQRSLFKTNLMSKLDLQQDQSKRDDTHISVILEMKKQRNRTFNQKLITSSKSYELKLDIMHRIGELKNVGKICKTCNLKKMRQHLLTKNEI